MQANIIMIESMSHFTEKQKEFFTKEYLLMLQKWRSNWFQKLFAAASIRIGNSFKQSFLQSKSKKELLLNSAQSNEREILLALIGMDDSAIKIINCDSELEQIRREEATILKSLNNFDKVISAIKLHGRNIELTDAKLDCFFEKVKHQEALKNYCEKKNLTDFSPILLAALTDFLAEHQIRYAATSVVAGATMGKVVAKVLLSQILLTKNLKSIAEKGKKRLSDANNDLLNTHNKTLAMASKT